MSVWYPDSVNVYQTDLVIHFILKLIVVIRVFVTGPKIVLESLRMSLLTLADTWILYGMLKAFPSKSRSQLHIQNHVPLTFASLSDSY